MHYFRNLRPTLRAVLDRLDVSCKKKKNKKLCHMHIRLPGDVYSGFMCCVLSSLIGLRNYVQ